MGQNETGKESLMTARMISQTEYLAGGSTQQGGMFAPALILRSKDGGATHVSEGASVMGNSLTSIDCLSADHCYATALSALQICNILALGGATWNQVQNVTGVSAMPLSVAAHKTGSTNVGVTGPLESSLWSLDGERFVESIGAPFASQDIKNEGGHFMIAGGNGPCIGPNGGDVIYFAAGQWPSDSTERVVKVGEEQHVKISRNIRIVDGKKMIHVEDTNDDPVNDYTAELWKSTDAGETWTNLMSDEGNFYFNDIHCADETHCVAVAEGFGESGGETGAHIYMTSDGETFNRVHTQNETGKESLMTARMISQTEYLAGGSTQQGGMFAPALILRSKDAGATHVNEGASGMGNSLTSMDCLSADHCYATALSALQICNILELGGNTPPAPPPAGAGHYEKPPCQDDEAQASVTDTDGAV